MVAAHGFGRGGTGRARSAGDARIRVAAWVPIGFAIGAVLQRLLLAHPPPAVRTDLAQPLIVATYWQHYGALFWAALAIAVAVGACGLAAALAAARRGSAGLATTIGASALACVAALAMPVVFSSDVYAYAGYGQMALHGINPYAHARITLRDPLLDAMLWQWGNPPPMCVYGPAFVWLAQALVALLLPLGTAAPLWGFRVLSCIALVACAPLAYAAFRPFGEMRARAAAAGIALNPVAIWSCAEGHNDAIVLAIVLAGFALAARSRAFTGALIVALGALLKAPALAAAGGFVLAVWREPALRARVLCGAAAGTAIVVALAIPLEYGVRAHLAPDGAYFPQFSLQYAWPPLAFALVALFAVPGARDLLRGSLDGAAYLGFAALLGVPNPYPWYGIWLLPLAFLAEDPRVTWGLLLTSLLMVTRYYGDATTDLSRALGVGIALLQFAPGALLLIAARTSRARRARRESRTGDLDFAPLRRS